MPRFSRTQNVPARCDHHDYKSYLRFDFNFSCAYCGLTEASVFGIAAFGIDHFRPKKLFPELTCVYRNLYYCCNDCNRYKGAISPSTEFIAQGHFFPDPCECDPLDDHLIETEGGGWEPVTRAGAFALEILRLNREPCIRFRRKRILTQQRISKYRAQLEGLDAPAELRTLLDEILLGLEGECLESYGHGRSALATATNMAAV